ncbi:chitotriosidase-1 [Caerostris extrusa]|uniref:Chitotriosidase-1 n=1 Tax=Caerostris extrusa TaxID=172846 RepID=A0AAV4N6P2_CAEEX|nr:chitotriosidase-1 [Caerostris extrusa]
MLSKTRSLHDNFFNLTSGSIMESKSGKKEREKGEKKMGIRSVCLLLLVVAIAVYAQSKDRNQKKYKVVCYLGSWANYRGGDAKFLIEHIDPNICTHVIYGFAKLANNQIAAYDPYLDLKENWGLGAFQRFNNLKKANPS